MKTDALGNVVKLDDPSAGTRIRTFDSFGLMLTEQVQGEQSEKDVSFIYNGFGEVFDPTSGAERLDLWLRQCGSDGEQLIAGRGNRAVMELCTRERSAYRSESHFGH